MEMAAQEDKKREAKAKDEKCLSMADSD